MRRIVLPTVLATLAFVLAASVAAAGQKGSSALASSTAASSARVVVVVVERAFLHVAVSSPNGSSTQLTATYLITNGEVSETNACVGQFEPGTGGSVWGCTAFPISALSIESGLKTAEVTSLRIPAERCDAAGCTAKTMTVSATLEGIRDSRATGRDQTQTVDGRCATVVQSSWENTAAVGNLTIDGTSYAVEPSDDPSGGPVATIIRSPTTSRTTCR